MTATMTIAAEKIGSDWTVLGDESRWWPYAATQAEIASSDDPEAAAVRICREQPMRGRWVDFGRPRHAPSCANTIEAACAAGVERGLWALGDSCVGYSPEGERIDYYCSGPHRDKLVAAATEAAVRQARVENCGYFARSGSVHSAIDAILKFFSLPASPWRADFECHYLDGWDLMRPHDCVVPARYS